MKNYEKLYVVLSEEQIKRANFGVEFLVGYRMDSSAGCFAACAKLLAECKAGIFFLVMSNSSPTERKIRAERENSSFSLHFDV